MIVEDSDPRILYVGSWSRGGSFLDYNKSVLVWLNTEYHLMNAMVLAVPQELAFHRAHCPSISLVRSEAL